MKRSVEAKGLITRGLIMVALLCLLGAALSLAWAPTNCIPVPNPMAGEAATVTTEISSVPALTIALLVSAVVLTILSFVSGREA